MIGGYIGWIALWVMFAGLVYCLALKLYDAGDNES